MLAKLRTAKKLKSPRKSEPKAQESKNVVKVIPDKNSTARTEAAKDSKGHDERGQYGKGASDAETADSYPDRPSRT